VIDYKKHINSELISSVNITPFTDVVLVILIVFMVSAPGILSSHLDILLPKTGIDRSDIKVSHTIALDQEGMIYVNEKRVTDDEFTGQAKEWSESEIEEKILLNADKRVSHGRVVEVLDILRAQGVSGTYVGAIRE